MPHGVVLAFRIGEVPGDFLCEAGRIRRRFDELDDLPKNGFSLCSA